MKKEKRQVELLVISDVHLGTYGCRAKELLQYMKSVEPEKVILNGDIIDMWQFSKRYWPKSHMKVIQQVMRWISKGIPVYYITGNHDEMLRKFAGFQMGSLQIENKLLLELNGEKVWIFHGDVFDVTMQHSRWLTKLGSHGYDMLILINASCNWVLGKLGREKISLSKNIKDSVKKAVKFINDFESIAADIAIQNGYHQVICGHIHHPEMKELVTDKGKVMYLNSGDWIENLTALEYAHGSWSLYKYAEDVALHSEEEAEQELMDMPHEALFEDLLKEFSIVKS